MNRAARAWTLVLLAGPATLALAQQAVMNDPTRPPASLSAPAPGNAPAAAGPQLQSILLSRNAGGRRIAVIDGKTVREGQRVDGAVVEAIRANEVVLRHGTRRSTLTLFRPAQRAAAGQP